MILSPVLDRRPIIVALAGPNGAGKSTFYEAHLAHAGLYFVNADVVALSLGLDAYRAAEVVETLRRQLAGLRESFIFETVFSDPVGSKLAFLKDAGALGYTVVLVFIGIAEPEISETRVAMRVAGGGHDVPREKLIERFPRTMNNLKAAIRELSNVWIYDHSDLAKGYRLVARMEDRNPIEIFEPTPEWLQPLLP